MEHIFLLGHPFKCTFILEYSKDQKDQQISNYQKDLDYQKLSISADIHMLISIRSKIILSAIIE